MEISPDTIVFWQWGDVKLNATILFTWVVMALLVLVSWLVTRRVTSDTEISRWQNFLEVVVSFIRNQIEEIASDKPERYMPFVGTLFLFIVVSNSLGVVPGFQPPTGSLSTTAALSLCVLVAVPVFGISSKGVLDYLSYYVKPTFIMLPFNVIGEVTRTLSLAVRLFGNVMSGSLIAAILLSLAPLFFPVLMNAFGLLVGIIQAYIFTVLSMVYIASGVQARDKQASSAESQSEGVE